MTISRTVTRRVFFQRRRKGRKSLRPGEQPPSPPCERVPRVSRLMALAIRFERLIADGHVRDQAELAALGRVTTARVSQIMNLLLLAPDVQEAILFLAPTAKGRDRIKERDLRSIAIVADWRKQRRLMAAIQ